MKVLLAVDGSPCSQAAVESLLNTQFDKDAQIQVVSVVDFYEPLPAIEGAKEKEIEQAKTLVQQTVEKLQAKFPDNKISGATLDGYTQEELVSAAQTLPADLLIVGSHGRGGLSLILLGSVSRALIQSAPCAVRISRIQENGGSKPGSTFNVLLPLDESGHSKHTMQHVLASHFPSGVKFKCITIIPRVTAPLIPETKEHKEERLFHHEELRRQAHGWLENCVDQLDTKFGAGSASCEVLSGDSRERIIEHAKEWPANLIMLGSHGRKMLNRLVLGSTAETVAAHAPCSVEITRAPGEYHKKTHIIM